MPAANSIIPLAALLLTLAAIPELDDLTIRLQRFRTQYE
jgi:hypothetical protein